MYCASPYGLFRLGKPCATTHKEELVPKPRVSVKKKLSWRKRREPGQKMTILAGGKILEVGEYPRDQRTAWR